MNIEPVRVYSGALMTSLNSSGIHVSLLKLSESHRDRFVGCLDDETTAPCWPGGGYSIAPSVAPSSPEEDNEKKKTAEKVGISLNEREQRVMKLCLKNACMAMIEEEARLNELDRGCGDGDCGSTLRRLADGIVNASPSSSRPVPLPFLRVSRYPERSGRLVPLASSCVILANGDHCGGTHGRHFRRSVLSAFHGRCERVDVVRARGRFAGYLAACVFQRIEQFEETWRGKSRR